MKFSCYLHIEVYDFTYGVKGGKGFYIGIVNNNAKKGKEYLGPSYNASTLLGRILLPDSYWVYNILSVRLENEYSKLDFEKFKIDLKNEVEKYKKENNVLFITGYKRIIEVIEDDFDFNINQIYK